MVEDKDSEDLRKFVSKLQEAGMFSTSEKPGKKVLEGWLGHNRYHLFLREKEKDGFAKDLNPILNGLYGKRVRITIEQIN